MSPDQQPTPHQQPTKVICQIEAMAALYQDLGESRHAVFERNVELQQRDATIAALNATVKERDATIAELQAQLAPQAGETADTGG